jgi:hypothetical protein
MRSAGDAHDIVRARRFGGSVPSALIDGEAGHLHAPAASEKCTTTPFLTAPA